MKTKNRNKVLMIHGVFLLVVTVANTASSLIGLSTGKGVFGFIKNNPMSEVGLFQAYLLMLIIGIVLIMNSRVERSWRYDLLGLTAHLIPLSALLLFQDVVKDAMGLKIFIASAVIHIPWILIELISAFIYYKRENEKAIQ